MSSTVAEKPFNTMTAQEQLDSKKLTGHQKSLIGMVITGNVSEFFDIFIVGFVVAILVKEWSLTGPESGIILACAGLGTVLGAISWGALADRFGRRNAFVWYVVIFTVFTFACLFVGQEGWFGIPGWIIFAVLRVLVGFGVGGLNITSIPYVQEFVPTKHRGFLAGLGSVFIPAGLLLGSLASNLAKDNWHLLIGIGTLPILLIFWARVVPESPRYRQKQGDEDGARQAYAWALDIPVEQVGSLPPVPKEQKSAYALVFGSYKKSLLVITIGSFMFMLGSFTIQSWGQTLLGSVYGFSLSTVALLFALVSVADLLGRLGSAYLADAIGRRYTMLIFGILGGVGCLVAAFNNGSSTVFFIGILIAMTFGDGAFGILNAFGGEQFPTAARSTGLGLGYGIGAIAKIIGPYMMGAVIGGVAVADADPAKVSQAFILFAVCLFIGAITYMFAKETRGKELEEV